MTSIARSGTWDEASSPAATRLARRFEDAWRDPRRRPRDRPDPARFLEDDAPPAAWLALLRADLNLRWDEGEAVRVEEYRDRFPELDPDTMVALCYEEFCRREEDGRAPFPAEYDERFPNLSDRLRRVFDIHELVGNAASTDLHLPGPEQTPFPETSQTIGGFHLVEELGRGSFARVFLARERQLADRPVALKVARTGSREPQTLARLQHTHIVPVHSYRTDPATGLHLLCMPYFGRVTLARLLSEPSAKVAPTGRELLETLDRLDPPTLDERRLPSSARATLGRLPYARAIAWWGSRLADALAHAHDRGVLHRDIKPSNVLLTGDGLPMLLDFNLAGEPWEDREGFEPDRLGGTLAYMAPEHLEAMASGRDDALDLRADLFSMGVLLFEALTGTRPFPCPTGQSVPEALRRAAEDRMRPPPRLRAEHPEIPAPLERVIRRCLEPDRADRYPNANELAADLQAVADDAPLRWTREPLHVRALRKGRRSWRRALLIAFLAGSAVALAMLVLRDEDDRARDASIAVTLLEEGRRSLQSDDFPTALARLDEVSRLAAGREDLAGLAHQAIVAKGQARLKSEIRRQADTFSIRSSSLRYSLIGVGSATEITDELLRDTLGPFRVLDDPMWSRSPGLAELDATRKARLLRDVEELLFLAASRVAPTSPRMAKRGLDLCERASGFASDPRPWRALRDWLDDRPETEAAPEALRNSSALACIEWGVLHDRQGRKTSAVRWMNRAVSLEPGNAWYQFSLATLLARAGDALASCPHYDVAVALEPENPRFRLDRAAALRSIGEWGRADEDERRASRTQGSIPGNAVVP
jgi:serine/threonine protein kinase